MRNMRVVQVAKPARVWLLYLLAVLVALAACGGGSDGDEEWISVWTEARAVPDRYPYTPELNATARDAERLRQLGVDSRQPRCADHRDPPGKPPVAWIGGVPPVYLIFDIPKSKFALAKQLGWVVFDAQELAYLPLFDCASRGL